jgi:signal transduction histidine kinase
MTTTPGETGPCDADELRSLFLFEGLTSEQLAWLCQEGHVEQYQPGLIFTEGEPAECCYVLLDGTLVLSRNVGGDDVEVVRSSQRGVYAGAFQAFLGDQVPQVYTASLRVPEPSRLFVMSAVAYTQMIHQWFPMALHLLEGLFFNFQNAQQIIGQRERLLALGSLSAGLTHELNNPAAAAGRATGSLRDRVAGMRSKLGVLAAGRYDAPFMAMLIRLQEEAVVRASKVRTLSPVETADAEDAVADWLDDKGIPGGWDLAPPFVQAGLDSDWLDQVDATVSEHTDTENALGNAIRWLGYTVETELLMNEITESVTRISSLVGASRQYSQLDRAPYQVVDVHELLDATLAMLGAKIGPGIRVVRDYNRSLPRIPAYPAELNQVWTNLIDNAVFAMGETGTLTVRTTAADGNRVLVEFADTGPGVPEDITGAAVFLASADSDYIVAQTLNVDASGLGTMKPDCFTWSPSILVNALAASVKSCQVHLAMAWGSVVTPASLKRSRL